MCPLLIDVIRLLLALLLALLEYDGQLRIHLFDIT